MESQPTQPYVGSFPTTSSILLAAPADRGPQLHVTPAAGLVDDPIHVWCTSLTPRARIRLASRLEDEKGAVYRCECFYVADARGTIDTKTQPSVGGSFEGVHPQGLLEHLASEVRGRRLLKRDVMRPWVVTVELGEGAVAQSRTVERWHLGPGVMMHEVNVGRLRGYIFEPPAKHDTHVPAVLDLFGVVGGCQTFRAALLASHGFLTFALAYLNYKDLPKSFPRGIDLSYFEEGARCA